MSLTFSEEVRFSNYTPLVENSNLMAVREVLHIRIPHIDLVLLHLLFALTLMQFLVFCGANFPLVQISEQLFLLLKAAADHHIEVINAITLSEYHITSGEFDFL